MPLENKLDANEARVFGVLIEKSLTTPDQYPLSINGATAGSNQSDFSGGDRFESVLCRVQHFYSSIAGSFQPTGN